MSRRDRGTGDAAELRLAEALRARASGAAGHPLAGDPRRRSGANRTVVLALVLALVAGVAVGVGLALLSVAAPGLLPGSG